MKFKKLRGFDRVNKNDVHYHADMPITMAEAVLDSEERAERLNKEFAEQTKVAEEFVKEQEGKKNFKITLKEPVYKKMGLVEHASRMTRKQLKESRLNEEVNRVLFDRVKNALDSVFESTDMTGNEFRECIKKYLYLFETDEDDVDESLKESGEMPYAIWVKYVDDGSWHMWGGSYKKDLNPDFLDSINHPHYPNPEFNIENRYSDAIVLPSGQEPTNEAKECPNCGEKDCDGSCEKELTETKHGQKDDDLWTRIYNNLATHLDINEVNTEVPDTFRGCRYNEIRTDFDGNIIIYGTKPEEFDFAKKVADHYGVEYDEPKEDTNSRTNSYYKYSMKIKVPMDESLTEATSNDESKQRRFDKAVKDMYNALKLGSFDTEGLIKEAKMLYNLSYSEAQDAFRKAHNRFEFEKDFDMDESLKEDKEENLPKQGKIVDHI